MVSPVEQSGQVDALLDKESILNDFKSKLDEIVELFPENQLKNLAIKKTDDIFVMLTNAENILNRKDGSNKVTIDGIFNNINSLNSVVLRNKNKLILTDNEMIDQARQTMFNEYFEACNIAVKKNINLGIDEYYKYTPPT